MAGVDGERGEDRERSGLRNRQRALALAFAQVRPCDELDAMMRQLLEDPAILVDSRLGLAIDLASNLAHGVRRLRTVGGPSGSTDGRSDL